MTTDVGATARSTVAVFATTGLFTPEGVAFSRGTVFVLRAAGEAVGEGDGDGVSEGTPGVESAFKGTPAAVRACVDNATALSLSFMTCCTLPAMGAGRFARVLTELTVATIFVPET